MYKAIIFDFDGVIHDTFNFHKNNIKQIFGIDLSDQEFKDIHNGNFYQNTNHALKNIDWPKYVRTIENAQGNLEIEQTIKDIMAQLNKEYELFVITSGSTKNISNCLQNNDLRHMFNEVLGLEIYKSKVDKFNFIFNKYGLKSKECIFITDTLGDIIEANEVNVKTIGVTWGFHEKERLEKGNPYKIISNHNELIKTISNK